MGAPKLDAVAEGGKARRGICCEVWDDLRVQPAVVRILRPLWGIPAAGQEAFVAPQPRVACTYSLEPLQPQHITRMHTFTVFVWQQLLSPRVAQAQLQHLSVCLLLCYKTTCTVQTVQ
jgi:hypothetical protein